MVSLEERTGGCQRSVCWRVEVLCAACFSFPSPLLSVTGWHICLWQESIDRVKRWRVYICLSSEFTWKKRSLSAVEIVYAMLYFQ